MKEISFCLQVLLDTSHLKANIIGMTYVLSYQTCTSNNHKIYKESSNFQYGFCEARIQGFTQVSVYVRNVSQLKIYYYLVALLHPTE